MATFAEVGGHRFLIGKLNARQQFDVLRRLGFVEHFLEMEAASETELKPGARWIAAMLSNTMGSVPQVDMDYVLDTCLALVQVERGGSLKPAWNIAARAPQFEDMIPTFDVMLELVDAVIQESCAPFLEARRAASRATLTAASTESDTNPSEC